MQREITALRKQLNVPKQLNAQDNRLAQRRRLDLILIAVTAGAVLGLIFLARAERDSQGRALPMLGENNRSRWATVYSLAERGIHNIDETPWPPTVD